MKALETKALFTFPSTKPLPFSPTDTRITHTPIAPPETIHHLLKVITKKKGKQENTHHIARYSLDNRLKKNLLTCFSEKFRPPIMKTFPNFLFHKGKHVIFLSTY